MDIDIEKLKANAEEHIPLNDDEKDETEEKCQENGHREKVYSDKDIECGFWIMRGQFMQK